MNKEKFYQWGFYVLLISVVLVLFMMRSAFERGREIGYNTARDIVNQEFPPDQGEIRFLTGEVLQKESNSLQIRAQKVSLNPLAEEPEIRTINISSQTKILSLMQKTSSQLEAELADQNQRRIAGEDVGAPPSLVEETQINLDGIAVGDTITILSDIGVRLAEVINAVEIRRFSGDMNTNIQQP